MNERCFTIRVTSPKPVKWLYVTQRVSKNSCLTPNKSFVSEIEGGGTDYGIACTLVACTLVCAFVAEWLRPTITEALTLN